ncbi:MAG: class II fructose-bisphosphate aldolase [Enterococcus sp.]|nr:class II fructose-bisphosphate aldolase [Enterococcus sp.]
MATVSAKEMLIAASKGNYAIGAFNITSLVQMAAIVEAAIEKNSPIIIQTSATIAKFLKPEIIVAIYKVLVQTIKIPVSLYLDHCTDVDFCKRCADLGYTNIMFDGSSLSYEGNIKMTRIVSDYCHKVGNISVEGELGIVSGTEDHNIVAEDDAQLCDPEQAQDFVERSGIDLFSPAIGTAHGVYQTENPFIDYERLNNIYRLLNYPEVKTPLVIHGGTGLKESVVKKIIKNGGSKFNISTNLKHILIDSTKKFLEEEPFNYEPIKMDKLVKANTKSRIKYYIDLLGSAGKA